MREPAPSLRGREVMSMLAEGYTRAYIRGALDVSDGTAKVVVAAGRLNPDKIDEKTVARYLNEPDMADVDLFVRSSGENRTSNFLLWQSAYAEMVFLDTLWPDFDRRHLWAACEEYASRQRRFGSA